MEKAQIVRCALMQIVAVIYSVFASGVATKLNRNYADLGYPMSDTYYRALSCGITARG